MPFHFKMQKVLDYREQLEEEAKVRLAQAIQRHDAARETLERFREELARAERKRADSPLMDAAACWLMEQYIKGLAGDVSNAAMQERMTAQMVEEARKLLAARAIDKKLLAKLRERQKTAWAREELLKEQHFNDEIATIRYKASAF